MPDAAPPQDYQHKPPHRRAPLGVQLAAVVAVVALVLLGVWAAGALVSDSMAVAMALTTVWFGVLGGALLLFVRSRRSLLVPVLGAYALAAAGVGGYLGYTSFFDKEVDEDVAVGAPAAAAGAGGEAGEAGSEAGAAPAPAGNVELAAGDFRAKAHPTTGRAAVVELAEGGRVLTLTEFETDPGPDLRVYLATDPDAGDFKDLGALKGNKGDQQYEIPEGVDIERYGTVVIWCRAFTVNFGDATLARS